MTMPNLVINSRDWVSTLVRWATEIKGACFTSRIEEETVEKKWRFPIIELTRRVQESTFDTTRSTQIGTDVPQIAGDIALFNDGGKLAMTGHSRGNGLRIYAPFVNLASHASLESRTPVDTTMTLIGATVLNMYGAYAYDIIQAWISVCMSGTTGGTPVYIQGSMNVGTTGGTQLTSTTVYFKPQTNDNTGKADVVCFPMLYVCPYSFTPNTTVVISVWWGQPEGAAYTRFDSRRYYIMGDHRRVTA